MSLPSTYGGLTRETAYGDEAVDNLLGVFKDLPRIEAFVRAYADRITELEDAAWEVMVLLSDVDQALSKGGVWLERLGQLVGASRKGTNDDTFAAFIRARIAANRSRGTPDDLVLVLQRLYECGENCALVQRAPAWFALRLDEAAGRVISEIRAARVLQDAKPAGVRCVLEYNAGPIAEAFTLSDTGSSKTDSSLGLSDADHSTGGRLAGAVRGVEDERPFRINGLQLLHTLGPGRVITDPASEPEVIRSLDESGNQLHLSGSGPNPSGPDLSSPGGVRRVSFDGSEYLSNTTHLDFGSDHLHWFFVISAASSFNTEPIVHTRAGFGAGIEVSKTSNDFLTATLEDSAGTSLSVTSTTDVTGASHFVEVVYDPDDKKLTLYVDGSEEDTDTDTGMGAIASDGDLYVGRDSSGTFFYAGDLMVLGYVARSSALSEEEVSRLRDEARRYT